MAHGRRTRIVITAVLSAMLTLTGAGIARAQSAGTGRTTAAQGGGPEGPPQRVALHVPPAGTLQELVLKDGTRALGRIERIDGVRVTFRTEGGATMEVDVAQIVSADIARGRMVDQSFWEEDSNPTRLFFSPTGRTLKRGESYIGVYEIIMPFVQVGVTDRFSIGGGTPLFLGSGDLPVWLTPKFRVFSKDKTDVSVGVMHFLNIGDASAGIAYGVVTHGTTDSAITIGVGHTYFSSDGYTGGASILMVGGEHRMSRSIKFVTENYFASGGGMVSGGIRFMGERLSADLGLISPLNAGGFFAAPMVNFVWKMK
jgi:hypothetical protein